MQVAESFARDLGVGMPGEISGNGHTWRAAVSTVSPEVVNNEVAARLRFVGAVPQGMRQNQRVSSRIVLEARDGVLKVARGPFLDTGGGRIAFVVNDDIGTRRKIRTGGTSVAEVEILEGLAAGDRIIVSNLSEFERVERIRLD
jgi:HlyD family secretion protein